MSTLVNLLLAFVLSILGVEVTETAQSVSAKQTKCTENLEIPYCSQQFDVTKEDFQII